MCIQRLRYTQEKQHALARVSRREVAKLLSEGKENKAHYRVEALINDDVHIELLEILELYCELLHTRIGLLNTVVNAEDLSKNHNEDGINEAVRALLYCVVEVSEIRELQQLKDLFALKFGLDFIKKISDEKEGVPEKILKKCAARLPSEDLVILYLKEIARSYDVDYSNLDDESENNLETSGTSTDNESEKGKPILAVEGEETESKKHPIVVKKPRKNSENQGESLNIPRGIRRDVKVLKQKESVNSREDDLDELKKRFAALRR